MSFGDPWEGAVEQTRASKPPPPEDRTVLGWKDESELGKYRRLGEAGVAPGQTVLGYGEPPRLRMCSFGSDSKPEWWLDTSDEELCLSWSYGDYDVDEPLRSAIVRGVAALLEGTPVL